MKWKHALALLALAGSACISAFAADQPKNAALKPTNPQKLIALTFDDGPRPYVLYGQKDKNQPGLLDVLDRAQVKATFFVMGWRLTPKTWGDHRYETNIGVTCTEAAKEALRRGHEIENHTYSHVELKTAERKKGEQWVIDDIMKGAEMVKTVTGKPAEYLRPPDWILPDDARAAVEKRGVKVLTIAQQNPIELRDVNSLDYLCAGKGAQCPKPSLANSVVKQIEAREKKGVFTHVLAFHELTTTTAQIPEFVAQMKARGYRFVTVQEYMKAIGR